MDGADPTTFPPPGWVTNREAARILGVALESMTQSKFKWRPWLKKVAKCVRVPTTGGRINIYPLAELEAIVTAREQAAKPSIPEGFVDKDGACAFFGVKRHVWKVWIRQGKIRCGQRIEGLFPGGKRTIYAIADLQALKQELFGEDKLYKGADQIWHVPNGYVGREEAWETFGVSKPVWERWEREGKITCGQRVPSGPKMYKVEDIEQMLEEFGKWCPPYPDPDRPGVYRVPLSGRQMKRREALIDVDVVGMIAGLSCAWSSNDSGLGFVAISGGDHKGMPLRRLIMGAEASKLNVRHINDDPLDCRRENLIVRTVAQRSRNARKMKLRLGRATSSRFKGVYWESYTKRWGAGIHFNGKKRKLGRFRDEIAAAVAYDEAAQKWFGEHARLNFPDGVDARLAAESARVERALAA